MTIDIGLNDPVFVTINIHELSLAQYLDLPFPEKTLSTDATLRWKSYRAGSVDLTFYCPRERHADRATALDSLHGEAEAHAPGARAVDDV